MIIKGGRIIDPLSRTDEVLDIRIEKGIIAEIEKSGLKCEIGAMSTTVEGDFDEVFELLKKVHKIPFNLGCERVITVARVDEKAGGLTIDEKLRNHR